jgi:hypothetical protein
LIPGREHRRRFIINIDDILANPALLSGKTPDEIQAMLGETPGWSIEPLARGSKKGQGWALREYSDDGKPTGQVIRWHRGGGHHGPAPYWRVSSHTNGKSDIIR